jgi:hypothetical protein
MMTMMTMITITLCAVAPGLIVVLIGASKALGELNGGDLPPPPNAH